MAAEDTVGPRPACRPVQPNERIETLDIVRGFALLCIFIVNWSVNTLWDVDRWGGFSGLVDQIAYWTNHLLLDNKSYPMFAFLFGLGFAIQLQRAGTQGGRFAGRWIRRLAVLFAIGVAHDVLTERDTLWVYALFGVLLLLLQKLDTRALIVLALVWVLVPLVQGSMQLRVRVARLTDLANAHTEVAVDSVVLDGYRGEYAFPTVPYTLFVFREGDALYRQSPGYPGDADVPIRLFAESQTDFFSRSNPVTVSFVRDSQDNVTELILRQPLLGREIRGRPIRHGQPTMDDMALRRASTQAETSQTYMHGTFVDIVSMRAGMFWENLRSFGAGYQRWLGDMFALFMLGLYAGRKRIFADVSTHQAMIRRVMWWGLAFGLTGATFESTFRAGILFDPEQSIPLMASALIDVGDDLGSPMLGLAYVAGLTLLLQRKEWRRRLAPLGAVGRTALTNYLLQSVVYVLLFFGYGLGWFGQVGAFEGTVLALSVFALQILTSQWWLRRFRFGPVEWLWRTITYAKLQPMRFARDAA